MMTIEDTRYAAAVAWVEQLVADRPELRATQHEFVTRDGMLWVEVQGGDWEARAWHAAVGGLLRASHVSGGVWRKEILGTRVCVVVVDDPHRRRDEGGMSVGLAFIVACVGLFLWGFTHGSDRPDGAWLLAVAIVGAVVLLLATGIVTYRRRERADAAYTAEMEKRLKQDMTGDHIWDA